MSTPPASPLPAEDRPAAQDRPAPPGDGLDFAGLALPGEDPGAISAEFTRLLADLRPKNEMARQLASRIFVLRLRLRRSARHEVASTACRMRRARPEWVEARLAEADRLMSWIAAEPATNARCLRKSPEGADLVLRHLEGLRVDLARPGGHRWGFEHVDHLLHLLGVRYSDVPVHRPRALTHAMDGEFKHLEESDGAGLDRAERKEWARVELLAYLDGKIADVKALLAGMDLEGLERDREEAATRAMFDASPEGVLARKHDAATERSLLRVMKEFRQVQAEAAAEAVADQPVAEELGSFFRTARGGDDGSAVVDPTSPRRGDPAARRRVDRPKSGPKGAGGRRPGRDRTGPGPGRAS